MSRLFERPFKKPRRDLPLGRENTDEEPLREDKSPIQQNTLQPLIKDKDVELFPNRYHYGLRILYEPTVEHVEPSVDIIFIHGLMGNSYGTCARILAFGYDADVTRFLGPVGQGNLRDHASALNGDLVRLRAKDKSVVSKESAKLVNGRPLLPIQANHEDIAKFANPGDEGYQRFDDSLITLACLQSLSFIQLNDRENDVKHAANGTCEWLSESGRLLWIKGKPGAGKPILLKYALRHINNDEFRSSNNFVILSFFFHGRGNDLQKTPLGLFRSLLHQLIERFPGVLSEVVQELQDFVQAALPIVLRKGDIKIFIDALDEAGEKAACELVHWFGALQLACNSASHKLKWASIEDEILNRSSGSFQWVVLVLPRAILQCAKGNPINKIKAGLQKIPKELNSLYKYILESLKREADAEDDLSQSWELIQWICLAIRSLTLMELHCAIAINDDTPYQKPTQPEMINRVKYLSGGLGEVSHQSMNIPIVQFIHQSVQDYFIEEGLQILFDFQSNKILIGRAHFELSKRCIKYFIMEEIHRSISEIEKAQTPLEDRSLDAKEQISIQFQTHYPLLRYAIKFWPLHIQIAEQNGVNENQDEILNYWNWPENKLLHRWMKLKCIGVGGYPPYIIYTQQTLLHIASYYNLKNVVEAIIKSFSNSDDGINLMDKGERTPLSYAGQNGHERIVRLLLHYKAKTDSKDGFGRTPLSYAAQYGREAIVKLLLDQKAETDSKDYYRLTPLLYAAEKGYKTVVKLLLDENVDINSRDENGHTSLWWTHRPGLRVFDERKRKAMAILTAAGALYE
ncbi:MAG: hypothetical protein M1834_002599 [Cirrosporium novae-zelandiae]|nr:MAG: hypothetical protein M1834_002599 [Cirrosporium novae-zelandiae]